MYRRLANLFRKSRWTRALHKRPTSPVRRARLGIEALDGRIMPQAGPVMPPISLNAQGTLIINGSDDSDTADVTVANGQVKVTLGHYEVYSLGGQTGFPHFSTIYVQDYEKFFNQSQVARISFSGKDGDDRFSNLTAIPSYANGAAGDDSLVGGTGNDELFGGTGSDTLEGRGGDDELFGGTQTDYYVFAGVNLGSDTVVEAANVDSDVLDFTTFLPTPSISTVYTVIKGATVDLASTDLQTVQIQSQTTNLQLTLANAAGIEQVWGTVYDDTIKGNARNNRLEGNSGADALYGRAGMDTLIGAGGRDSLFAGAGADALDGGTGNDYIVTVGGGVDSVNPGTGTDSLWVDANGGDTLINASGDKVNTIGGFYSYSYSYTGGLTHTPVSKELDGQDLADPIPYHLNLDLVNFSDEPLFSSNGPQMTDVDQNSLGDCYFLAKLSAMARVNPDRVREMVIDLGDGTYAVRFYNEAGQAEYVRVDGDLWVNSAGNPMYAGVGSPLSQLDSLWVAIAEKAWAFYRRDMGSYDSIDNHDSSGKNLMAALGESDFTDFDTEDFADGVAYLTAIKAALNAGKGVWFGGPGSLSNDTPMIMDDPNTPGNSGTFRRGQHIYVVDAVLTDANGTPTGIRLYHPHGHFQEVTNLDVIYFCSGGSTYFNF